jgi:hypothetical protein
MNLRKSTRVLLAAGWLIGCLSGMALAADPAKKTENGPKRQDGGYLRVARDEKKRPTALETAVVRFVPADPGKKTPVVDLVAAVHVAEPSFYDQLNKEFEQYDVVLYEMVAPEGTKPSKDGRGSDSPISAVQNGLTDLLELEFQLKGIDYSRKNFIHADMSPDEFSRSMRERDESLLSIVIRMMGYAVAQEASRDPKASGPADFDLLAALLDDNRALALKRVMAQQFEDMGSMTEVIDGPKGSTLISQRNKKVMESLQRQIDAGKKKIAIFYGAGHMADMAKRLEADFGLARQNTRWLKAWDLEGKR